MTFRLTARSALAALLIDMAAGQLSDVESFARILATYPVFPDRLVSPFSWGMAAEVTAGILP